jgi:peptide/nickel transport system ATP-binding protein
MQKGVVMEQGNAKEVIQNPKSDYTRALLACKPEGKDKLYYLPTLEKLDNIELIPHNPIGDTLLEVDDLTKQYGDFTAVDRVSFVIRKGETLGLVGESGCGKSTLSRMLMGLLPITSGTISWKSQPWLSSKQLMRRSDRKRIQMVFQDPFSSLNPKIPVGHQIMAPMEIHGIGQNEQERKAKTIYWLEKVGMPQPQEAFDKYPHAFSGGQRQRIVIARALAAEPDLIVCDESVAALDVSVQAQVLNLLNALKQELGLTYLFISHDMHVVNYMCDRVMVMQKGRLIEQG